MKPNCETVEYANVFLMSLCTKPSSAPNRPVTEPTTARRLIELPPMDSPWKNTGYSRATM